MGISRATVREALGALQLAGLVETRQGAGSFVVEVPPPEPLLTISADASPSAVLETRAIFEPAVVSLVARAAPAARADAEIDRLLYVMARSADPSDPEQRQRWSDADREFHRRFAEATGNPVLIAIAAHIAELMDEPLWRRLRDDSIAVPGRTELQLAEHRLIAAAVAEGDAELAAFHATEHINRARRYMALAD
jgi:DNA-binding FadR family transcriptional regulator